MEQDVPGRERNVDKAEKRSDMADQAARLADGTCTGGQVPLPALRPGPEGYGWRWRGISGNRPTESPSNGTRFRHPDLFMEAPSCRATGNDCGGRRHRSRRRSCHGEHPSRHARSGPRTSSSQPGGWRVGPAVMQRTMPKKQMICDVRKRVCCDRPSPIHIEARNDGRTVDTFFLSILTAHSPASARTIDG